jgi:prepilin-type N-terminal cleavage/methylation domain-containing protein
MRLKRIPAGHWSESTTNSAQLYEQTREPEGQGRTSGRDSGFSLVEVSLAILVVGLGLLAVFGLFPFGLRANEESIGDTRAAMFADHVFAGMRANAAKMTWTEWTGGSFGDGLTQGLSLDYSGAIKQMQFPPASGEWVQYRMDIVDSPRGVLLQVWDGKRALAVTPQGEFYTEFLFSGM